MTYEYICTACGHEWEASQSIKDDPIKSCPKCKKKAAKRQVSGGTGFVLKGGGWYADLYGSAKPATARKEDDSGDGDKPEKKKDASDKKDTAETKDTSTTSETGTKKAASVDSKATAKAKPASKPSKPST
jgi:putative FmdB family regulatory protein